MAEHLVESAYTGRHVMAMTGQDAGRRGECVHGALQTFPGSHALNRGKAHCINCGAWLVDADAAVAERDAEIARLRAIVAELEDRNEAERIEHERMHARLAVEEARREERVLGDRRLDIALVALRNLHGLRLDGVPKPLDLSATFKDIAALRSPPEGETR